MKYPHLAARLFNTPLLVHPQKLDAIIAGLGPRLLGTELAPLDEIASTQAMPAELFSTRNGKRGDAGYAVTDGVAVIHASGALVHRTRLDANSSYLLGYNTLASQLEDAMGNPDVHAVLQVFDSPGGEVSGAFEYGDRIHALRGKKPMYAIADSLAASAAYLGGSAFEQLAISQTGYAGSIGVVMRHVDLSGALEKEGVRVTHIYAGDHKIDGNPYEPMPKQVRADLQDEIDQLYALFVNAVARNTGLSAKAIRATQAAMYRGQAAVDMGLVARVATTDQLISELAALRARSYPVGQAARATANDKGASMSGTDKGGTEAATNQPALAQADLDRARAEGHAAGRTEGLQAGATAERERVSAILAHTEAADRTALAVQCIHTGLSVEQAGAILTASPKTSAAQGGAFGAAMAATGNPDVSGLEAGTQAEGADAIAGSILQVFRANAVR